MVLPPPRQANRQTDILADPPIIDPKDPVGQVKAWVWDEEPSRRWNPGQGDCMFHAVAQAWENSGAAYDHL